LHRRDLEPWYDDEHFASAHTGNLRCHFLAHAADFVPLRRRSSAQLSREFGRLAVQPSERFFWKVYFHALHGISVATEPQECKSGQGGASGRAPPKHFGTGLRKRSKSASDPG